MNKDIVEEVRKTLQQVHDTLEEINRYLGELRSDAEIVERLHVKDSAQYHEATTLETTDPRKPYLAGRQPRRDGDSFGTVLPSSTEGGTDGTTAEGKRQR